MLVKNVVIRIEKLACRGVEELELIADIIPSKANAPYGCRVKSEAVCVGIA